MQENQEPQHGQLIAVWLKLERGQLVRNRCRAAPYFTYTHHNDPSKTLGVYGVRDNGMEGESETAKSKAGLGPHQNSYEYLIVSVKLVLPDS